MECIDDHPVVSHRVRFRGRADITETQAPLVRDGHTVIWLVRARCCPPQYHPVTADSDDRYRFNIQDVEVVVPLDGDTRNQALAYLDHHGTAQGYLSFDVPRHPDALSLEQIEADLSLDRDLDDALAFLEAHNARRAGESLLDVLRRLLEPEPAAEPAPASSGEGVEVVGSVYRSGHPGATQAILEEQFGRS
jgi:hypothetical protein